MGGGMGGMGYGGGGGEVINNYYGDGGGGMGGGGGAMDYGGAPCRALGETKLLLQCRPLSLSCVAAFTKSMQLDWGAARIISATEGPSDEGAYCALCRWWRW